MNEDTADSNGRKLRRYKLYNSDHYKTKTIFFCCPLVALGSNIVMAAVNSKDERVLRWCFILSPLSITKMTGFWIASQPGYVRAFGALFLRSHPQVTPQMMFAKIRMRDTISVISCDDSD